MNTSKIKVCILIPGHYSDVMGGAQYQVKLLIDALILTGNYDIYYVTKNYDKTYKPSSYKIIPIQPGTQNKRTNPIKDSLSVISALKSIRPDVIYQRVAGTFTGAAAYYGKRYHCRTIWHISSDADVTPMRFSLSRYLLLKIAEQKLLNYGIQNTNIIISQTKHQASLLENFHHKKVNSVISNFHPPAEENIYKSDDIKVLWIANLKKIKQPEVFINLAKALKDVKKASFIMIGKIQGKSSWQQSLKKCMQDVDNLKYLGEIPQSKVNKLLSESHLLINTSLYEGFSNTFIQAWMREVPVISLCVNPDQLLDGNNLGVCSGSYHKLVEDARFLINNDHLRNTMGQAAKLYAEKYHSLDNINRIINLLNYNSDK